MALIKCPECGVQVSSFAESCPKCAYPIAGGGLTQAHGGKIQTVEQTSKHYKLQELLSVLLIIGGVVAMIAVFSRNEPLKNDLSVLFATLGTLGLVFGFIWLIVVRFKIWWHHG